MSTTQSLPGGNDTSARSLTLSEVERAEVARKLLGTSYDTPGGCRVWTAGGMSSGYGEANYGQNRRTGVHRLAYAVWVSDIAAGMTVDHLCFERRCINPEHLQLLSNKENARRQRTRLSSTCTRGHPFDEVNTAWTSGRRRCLECRRQYNAARN